MVTDDLAFFANITFHPHAPPPEKKKKEQERKERVARVLAGVSVPSALC